MLTLKVFLTSYEIFYFESLCTANLCNIPLNISIFIGPKAVNLKRGFFGKPHPYVKFTVVPRVRHLAALQQHHGKPAKTMALLSTVNPIWDDEVIVRFINLYIVFTIMGSLFFMMYFFYHKFFT